MGLDISVNCTWQEAEEAIEDSEIENKLFAASKVAEFRARAEAGSSNGEWAKWVHTCPGSYSGLHVVRAKLCEVRKYGAYDTKRWGNAPEEWKASHLLWHSDCEGWYLPDDFKTPIMDAGLSVGSSVRLLAELEEIMPSRLAAAVNDWGWQWDAVYVAAVASVITRTPIKFH